MMLPAALSSDSDGQSQETIILSNVNPSHPSHPLSSVIAFTPRNATLPVTGDSNNGSRLEENGNDTSDADDTDPGTGTAIDSESDIEGDAADGANSHISIPSDGGRPEVWTTGAYSSLKALVAEAKGAASKPVVRFIKKYLKGTKLIFVVGQTGTGKSSLLRELTGQDIAVGETHKSGTEEYEVCPAIIHGEQYLFVDTAGFGASDIKDFDNFYDVMSCLDALAPFVTIAGVLFVYGGTQDRMHAHDLTTIQWVKCFCGPEFYKYITIVTTKWDTLCEESFRDAWRRFAGVKEDPVVADILSPVTGGRQRYHGGSVYHHGVVMDDDNPTVPLRRLSKNTCADERAEYARDMIRDRYSEPPKVKLQVLREMEAGVSWDETAAAKVLRNSHLTIKLNVREDFLHVTVIPDEKPVTVELDAKRKARRSASTLRPVTALAVIPLPRASKEDPWAKRPPRSWYDRLWYWLEKAKELAAFYREQRRKAAANGASTTAWADLAGTLRHWWSGPRY